MDVAFAIEQSGGGRRGRTEIARRYAVSEGYKARVDGREIGVATLTTYRADGDDAPPALAWIGGMIVHPAARRQGAARGMLRSMMARSRELGVRVVGLDASENGRPLYEDEGFRVLGRTSRWARAGSRGEAVVSARHSVHPISISEAMEIAAFDQPRFGARRMPFLMSLLHEFPWRSFMSRDRGSGEVTGFVFANERAMGPLVADDEDAASALLSACESSGAPPKLIIMDDHIGASRVLAAAGYTPDGVWCTRMSLGSTPLPGRRESVYGAATWALG